MRKATAKTRAADEPVDWGIIRYAPGSGLFPEDDAAAFDGWYASRGDALAVAGDWRKRYPQWIIALVRQDDAWFGDGDFTTVRQHPLTDRERSFMGRSRSSPQPLEKRR